MSTHIYLLKVKKIVRETADAVTVYFEQPSDQLITYKPGQFLTLILTVDGEKIRRAYSLCTSPFLGNDELGVTIKAVEKGKMSTYINKQLKEGDTLEVMEPMGNFTTSFDANQKRHVVLIGGGSGITPLMSLALSLLNKESQTQVSLIYANRNKESIIFYNQLEELQKSFSDRFRVAHILYTPPTTDWLGYSGLLREEVMEQIMNQLSVSSFILTEYFICGPEPMMQRAMEILQKRNVSKESIHKESFTAPTTTSVNVEPNEKIPHEVKVIYDGQEYKFVVPPGKTILATALSNNIDLPYSCQSGLCTACRGKCLSGKVKLDEEEGLSDSELREGYVLTCVGHPLTDDVVIEIG